MTTTTVLARHSRTGKQREIVGEGETKSAALDAALVKLDALGDKWELLAIWTAEEAA